MGFSRAALGRSKGVRDVTFLPRQPVHSLLAGRRASRVRGRGLAFEELRQYLPGDDVRSIDWRVTARTGEPFVRVYTEEKDRPALFVVDQRLNMFFGTRRAMKSVAAAEVAALGAWRVLDQGDRVGGLVFDDERVDEVRPHRSRAAVMRLLDAVVTQNTALRADAPVRRAPGQLDAALDAAARIATHDHLVVVASDFDGHGPRTRDLLLRLALHNDVLAVLVYDPFLLHLPASGDLVVSDGILQVELGLGAGGTRKRIAEFAGAYGKAILAWEREIGVPVLPLSAAEETAPQLRRLLGRAVRTAAEAVTMADAKHGPDPATAAALEKLADIALPPAASWMPQTWGWAALAAVVLALGAWAVVRWRRRREANRYRREALTELATLEARLRDGAARAEALAAIPPLLKRVALAAWPRPAVASLAERRWVEFLRAHAGGAGFPDAPARLLDDVEYRSAQALAAVSADDAQAFIRAVRSWIEEHRVSA